MSEGVAFGNYRLLRRLARGGMAEVFLARQQGVEGFERRVAIKRILPHLSDSTEFRTMFLDEARLAAQLSHPNIIHIYDFGKVDDYYFIAMEYVDGVDLGRLIKQARNSAVPFELIARILADICAGLHYAHNITDGEGKRLNVVHRDVTPQNVLVTYDGVVKVVDFGIAKATWQASRTRPGVVKGKYAYMSPEQVEGRSLDARSDIFAVGICAYELLTGTPLFRRDNVTEAMKEIRDGKPIHPEQHRADIPYELLAVMKRALENARDSRYPSAAAMQLDLERYLKGAVGLATPQLLGDFLRREAPRLSEGELLLESADAPRAAPEPTPAPAPQRSGATVKGGTAPLSNVKPALSPAFDGQGSAPAPQVASPAPASSPAAITPASSAEELTSPGKPLRAGQSTSLPRSPGFADESDDDETRRDTRLPAGLSGEQPTNRAPKFTPSTGEPGLPGVSEAASTTPRPTTGRPERVEGAGRSGPFPGSPLGDHREPSELERAVPPSHPTAMLAGAPTHARRRRPWAVALIALVVAVGAAGAYRAFTRKAGDGKGAIAGINLPPTEPATPVVKSVLDGGTDATDAGNHVVTTALPVQTSATLGVNTRPSGAKVFIDGETLEMLTPVRTLPITAGPHHIVIERRGYEPREIDLSLRAGEHRVLDFELPEERSLQRGDSGSATSAKDKKKGGAPRVAGSGFLTAKTVPWSRAYDGARLLGDTPLVNIPLAEGAHTITFVNPDRPPVKKRIVVRAGEETRLSVSLAN